MEDLIKLNNQLVEEYKDRVFKTKGLKIKYISKEPLLKYISDDLSKYTSKYIGHVPASIINTIQKHYNQFLIFRVQLNYEGLASFIPLARNFVIVGRWTGITRFDGCIASCDEMPELIHNYIKEI